MKNLLGILIIVMLVILFLSQVGLSQTQRPVVLTVLGGALPQDSLSNKIYVKDSSATNNLAGYYVTPSMMLLKVDVADSSIATGAVGYVTPTMGALLAPKANSALTGTTTAQIVNIGVGGSGELHPLSVGGTLATAANKATIDTLGNIVGVAGTYTGVLSRTSAFYATTSGGTPQVTVGTAAGTAAGNFYADTAMIGFMKPASKSAGIDSFATTATRKAVYIAGSTADDIYFISPRLNYADGTPIAAVVDSVKICYFAKTDSLIVVRVGASGGQTGKSGANFSWIRMKGQ
jgi:hypothetical protein